MKNMNFRAFPPCLRGLFDSYHNYTGLHTLVITFVNHIQLVLNATMQYLLALCMMYYLLIHTYFPNHSSKGTPLEKQIIVMDPFLCFTTFE